MIHLRQFLEKKNDSHDGIRILYRDLNNIVLNGHWSIWLDFCDLRSNDEVSKIKEMIINSLPEYKLW